MLKHMYAATLLLFCISLHAMEQIHLPDSGPGSLSTTNSAVENIKREITRHIFQLSVKKALQKLEEYANRPGMYHDIVVHQILPLMHEQDTTQRSRFFDTENPFKIDNLREHLRKFKKRPLLNMAQNGAYTDLVDFLIIYSRDH